MPITAIELRRLRVWKEHLAVCQKLASLNGTSVLDEAFMDLVVNSKELSRLKESADDFYFKQGKRGFTRSYIRARFEELAAALDNKNRNN